MGRYHRTKKTDLALRESEKRFRELAELLPELVFECDLSGKLTFVNRIAFSVFGYTPQEYGTLFFTDLIAKEDREKAEKVINKLLSGKILEEVEYIAIRKDRARFPRSSTL